VAGGLAIGAVLLALLVAWVTGALTRSQHPQRTWLAVVLFVGGNMLLVLTHRAALGALGIAAMVAAVVIMLRLRRSEPA
jgi:hypothetical protein